MSARSVTRPVIFCYSVRWRVKGCHGGCLGLVRPVRDGSVAQGSVLRFFRRSLGFAGSFRRGIAGPRGRRPTTTRRQHPFARRPSSGRAAPAAEEIPPFPGGPTYVVPALASPRNSMLVAAAIQPFFSQSIACYI
jgi:hypothetical protein